MRTIEKNQKSEAFWDTEKVVSLVEDTEKIATRVAICTKDNKEFVDIRKFLRTADGYTQHTTKGISIPLDDLGRVTEALFSVEKEIKKRERAAKSEESPKSNTTVTVTPSTKAKTKCRWTAEQKRSRKVGV